MTDYTLLGIASELNAAAILTKRGNVVSLPTRRCKYDLAVDNGERFYKIQVKTSRCWTERRDGKRAYFVNIREQTGGRAEGQRNCKSVPYKPGAFDVLLVNIPDLDAWYVIPQADILNRTSMWVRPSAPERDKYARYRDGWSLIDLKRSNDGEKVRAAVHLLGRKGFHERPRNDSHDTASTSNVPRPVPGSDVLLHAAMAA